MSVGKSGHERVKNHCVIIAIMRVEKLLFVGAVHRYYESRWHLFNDSQPCRKEKALITRRNSQKKAYRKQVSLQRFMFIL